MRKRNDIDRCAQVVSVMAIWLVQKVYPEGSHHGHPAGSQGIPRLVAEDDLL